jgi:hypothetical protein
MQSIDLAAHALNQNREFVALRRLNREIQRQTNGRPLFNFHG